MTRDELLATMQRERAAWDALIASVPAGRVEEPGVNEAGWTIKDIIAHVAAYELWTANELRKAAGGTELASQLFSPDDSDDNTMDQRNAQIYEQNRNRPLGDIRADATLAYQELYTATAALSEAQLNDPQLLNWGGSTAMAIVPEQSYIHYQQHIPDISAWLDRRSG